MCFLCCYAPHTGESETLLPITTKDMCSVSSCQRYLCNCPRCHRMFCLDSMDCTTRACLTSLGAWFYQLPQHKYSGELVYAVSMMPEFFLAGFAWQGMAEWATRLFDSPYEKLSPFPRAGFAVMTGVGGGLGVFAGNAISHVITYLLLLLKNDATPTASTFKARLTYKDALIDSALYGLAALVADCIWQPIVMALGNAPGIVGLGVGLACGTAFLMTLIILRYFIFTNVWYSQQTITNEYLVKRGDPSAAEIEITTYPGRKAFSNDLVVSLWNVMLAAWFFVYTGQSELLPIRLSSPFTIEAATATAQSMFLAGQATLAGYGISQLIEIFMKWLMRACGMMTSDGYISALVEAKKIVIPATANNETPGE